jgi:hypothetical protein
VKCRHAKGIEKKTPIHSNAITTVAQKREGASKTRFRAFAPLQERPWNCSFTASLLQNASSATVFANRHQQASARHTEFRTNTYPRIRPAQLCD